MRIFRIADSRHPVWSGTGAMLVGGRFNSPGRPVIYGALNFAGAMLEVLVHARIGKVPKHHVWVEVAVPENVPIERLTVEDLPAGWDAPDAPDSQIARRFGDQWLEKARSAVLVVPSVVARAECNAVVNPSHPDAARLVASAPQPVRWNELGDQRLFMGGRDMPPA
ncbi:RES domain-containing protein [Caballeronia fortuita]|uniref:RES domain-containing protein n=1 Tax=Caballeronia fortuita TaxID=1777138 RepID=A0A158CLE5_9BURK|nr:RES family NAD+ phosphorylase [Caballeronia fortuita]SAK83112.1 RES domain-containing protein [Caballeronia fortuita]